MPDEHPPVAEKSEAALSMKSVGQGILNGIKNLIILREKLENLEAEGDRFRQQVLAVVKLCENMSGELKGINKRFDEVDKRVELAIKLNVREEIERHGTGTLSVPRSRRSGQPAKSPED
jgi:hypothetical protein